MASLSIDKAGNFPSHVCAAWLGHTEAIADEHFERTVEVEAGAHRAVRFPVRA